MKLFRRVVFWALVMTALTGLFYADQRASAIDRATPLRLLEDGGVRTMTMAQYLPLAMAAEMPASFEPQALRAQAVAVRTFALSCRRHEAEGADVCADSGCCIAFADEQSLRQMWGADHAAWMARLERAAAATDGAYLLYGGEPIQAVFHASSLGQTEDSGALWSPLPYLVSVDTPETPELVPGLVTEQTVSAAEMVQALGFIPGADPARWLEALTPDGAGRVQSLTVCGRTYSGARVRAALGLRSTAFDLRWEDGAFLFTVSGYGHGVGMSQYGAQIYALQGLDYRQILSHYYPGTELARYSP